MKIKKCKLDLLVSDKFFVCKGVGGGWEFIGVVGCKFDWYFRLFRTL